MNWISVKERLPELDADVPVIFSNGIIRIGHRNRKTGKWKSGVSDVNDIVTHWIPLQEPPKAEKGESV